jgi:2-(1,2-epoxy-1,2-dihydrophenyl)acetyl-CoA isomerase
MTETSPLIVSHEEGGIVCFTLNVPKQLNAISQALMDAMSRALDDAPWHDARVLVIRANGKGFSAGGDMASIEKGLTAPSVLASLIDGLHKNVLALHRLPLPVIASVNGAAAGAGFSLAMACDFAIAARSAKFVVAYPQLGTSSDGGLSHFLTYKLGASKALEVMLLRNQLSAEEALQLGLVTSVVDDDKLADETLAAARKIAQLPPHAVRELKQLVADIDEEALENQLELEKEAFLRCARTADFRDRVEAFLARQRARP